MRKKKYGHDYRSIEERIDFFCKKHKWKIIIFSFIIVLIMILISLIAGNDSFGLIIFLYPVILIMFIWMVFKENTGLRGDSLLTPIILALMCIAYFILGFFI